VVRVLACSFDDINEVFCDSFASFLSLRVRLWVRVLDL